MFYGLTETDLNLILKNGKRSSELLGYDFQSLIYCRFDFLRETIPELLKIGNFEKLIISIFADREIVIFESDLNRISANEVLYFINWIRDEFEMIAQLEQDNLVSEPDMDLISAGMNEMNQFGDLNIIDSIAGGDILKWNDIKKLRYNDIFDKQLKMLMENKIQKRLMKIKSKT